jgi:hypothetical protein
LEVKKKWNYEFDYLRVTALLVVLISHGYGIFEIQVIYPSLVLYMSFLCSVGVVIFFYFGILNI